MAYQEQRTFEPWKTNRIFFSNPTAIRIGSNGDYEQWSWDRFHWYDYVRKPELPPVPPPEVEPGVGRVVFLRREFLSSLAGGREEILKFWRDYFRNIMGFSEAVARSRAEEMLPAIMQDDEEFLMLL